MDTQNHNLINTLIWDWNGTLLDDVSICIDAINELLDERHLNRLSPKTYRDVFTFPVKNYYQSIGFNFKLDDWETVANDFIGRYDQKLYRANLFSDVVEVLELLRELNFKQYMVSAMQHDFLEQSVRRLGIRGFFKNISGIKDHFASSKLSMATRFIHENEVYPAKTCLVGDTIHDFEVAQALGLSCILVARGHQSFERLQTTGAEVIHSLRELPALFKLNGKTIKYSSK